MLPLLIIAGLGAGVLSAFFGVGGGVIIVPILYFLFPTFPPTMVIGTSLGVILCNSVLNSYLFYKQKLSVTKGAIFVLGPSMAVGAYIGIQVASSLNPKTIKTGLAIMLLSIAIRMLFKKKVDQIENKIFGAKDLLLLGFTGLFSGVISGTTGLGGGAVLVPVLIMVLKMPVNRVPLYSNIAMGFAAAMGVVQAGLLSSEGLQIPYQQFSYGHIHFLSVGIMFLGSLAGAKIGVRLNKVVEKRKSEYAFSTFLFLVSSKIFYSIFTA